ncbi:accessory factor UbiK family protein [Magnetospira thiophila]
MQTRNPLFDDMARLANGAMSTLTGIKDEVDTMIRQRLADLLSGMDLVTREEFEAVQAMAAKARMANEDLEKRLAALEAAAPAKPTTGKKSAAKDAD